MRLPTPFESSSPPASRDTAAPTPGFGSVMEQEHNLQASTNGFLDSVNGPHASSIDRILRNQHLRLSDNIALLEQRYEMLPHPMRFEALRARSAPLRKARRAVFAMESIGLLPALVAQHVHAIENLGTLIAQTSEGGQAGELILTEVVRNHTEMASMLTELLKADESARDMLPHPVLAAAITPAPTPGTNEGRWENEGGATVSSLAPFPPRVPHAA
jgi:hypothetical protein